MCAFGTRSNEASPSFYSQEALKPSQTEASTVEGQPYPSCEVPARFSHRRQKMQAQQGQKKTSGRSKSCPQLFVGSRHLSFTTSFV